jgi:hypothetical protein
MSNRREERVSHTIDCSSPGYQPPRGTERVAYTIMEFCDAHRISRGTLYGMWQRGLGPKILKVGAKVLIAAEDAAEWRRQMAVTSQEATPGKRSAAQHGEAA